ncbi:glycosyl transferase [Siculibacillus lacustris]|uniref:protein O-GlcNAc transferase n=1 Tax=Siculibacillus lacustris TaxID=1549641 RepID=A0A4Q9VVD4_9HYPH|nr:glycosyl transferase [Siculibacillus lacustris]TBW39757.1 glycosyl transferase [Siculibacillus lacustris]
MSGGVVEALPALPIGRSLGVVDLIRAAEKLRSAGESAAAEQLYAGWVATNRDDPLLYAVLFNFSVILSDSGQIDAARQCLEQAIALNPDFLPLHINLGRTLERLGAVGQAIGQWTVVTGKLAQIDGAGVGYKTTALNQIARALEAAGQDETAEDMLRRSLEIDCHQREVAQHFTALRQRTCTWPVIAPQERIPRAMLMAGISPLSAAAFTDDPLLHLAMAWHYNAEDVGTPEVAHEAWPVAERGEERLRIGYLSSDLREHAVGYLMAEVPELHDRTKVEIFAYYCGPVPAAHDGLNRRYLASVDHWLDISQMDDATAAARIVADGIQILVDVNGYTREGRTKLLALRPAPIIVNWLGYPGTTGSPYHHYIVADDWIVPEDHEVYYSEKVLRLPCYQPNDRKRVVDGNPPTRTSVGLPEDAFVYCCFNGTHKITRFTFERWMKILAAVPGSVLWLLTGTDATNERLRRHAAGFGIAPERIVFAAKMANAFHLARYRLADLFLDTTPYGAHTTASDALWMGVPVLTVSGRSFASRVCGSLIRSAGLPELVATSIDDYVATAIAYGRDRAALAALAERLVAGRDTCVLFDTPLLVRSLEDLYATMWADRRAGRLPVPDLDGLAVHLEVGAGVDHEAIEIQAIPDYRGWWRERLARRHRFRPIPPGTRLFASR